MHASGDAAVVLAFEWRETRFYDRRDRRKSGWMSDGMPWKALGA